MGCVLLLGCGRMGGAMARQWRQSHQVFAYDPNAKLPEGVERLSEDKFSDLSSPLTVVLAVKPQAFASLEPILTKLRAKAPLFISIMAGLPLHALNDRLGQKCRLVRAMPNTPAAIGKGMIVATSQPGLPEQDRLTAAELLGETGEFAWVEDEAIFDAVTAVSGSGPAYFYRFTEALAKAGEAAGLPSSLAVRLARATFIGAAALAEDSDKPIESLRADVTSPKGTTAAGLSEFDRDRMLDALCMRCVIAAKSRSNELSQ